MPAVIAIGIGGMLGTGIFVLPGLAATKIGASLWLAYLIAAICILPAAYSKSEPMGIVVICILAGTTELLFLLVRLPLS